MANVRVEQALDISADQAWPVFSDFSVASGEPPEGCRIVVQGAGVGAERRMTFADGTMVVEKMTSLDNEQRMFTYAVVNDDAPLPFTDYSARVQIEHRQDGSCHVVWESRFVPKPGLEASAQRMLEGAYKQAIDALHDVARRAIAASGADRSA